MGRPVGPRGESKARLVDAALVLIAEHGVSGTSLQMIADSLGITKAAVYHQFPTKAEIVRAVVSPVIERMEAIADAAEAAPPETRFDVALEGLVDMVIDKRDSAAALRRDPVVTHLLEADEGYRATTARIDALFIGENPTQADRVALILAGGTLMVSGSDPTLATVDRETLRAVLLSSMRALLPRPHAPRLA
ncbi:TetR/AcrR family transcriptional regulator [Glaciihabitans sp. dw_435]|uniref:TetR/AcrR family transcriptional regulator n=1 Tax=Glaciihabitans sp. dw_435 TaxID=2720081 RepID=UPI001BD4BF54|nr:TetR/AcrR family transcriptional regulator [Glaciihabitans sp. dw_435]